jgi:hypothetical protein
MPSEGIEIALYFDHLERQFIINNVSAEHYLPILNQLLNDKARHLIGRLSTNEMSAYDMLKESIMREFQLTPSRYREHLVKLQKQPSDTYVHFTTSLEIALRYYWNSRGIAITNDNELARKILDLSISDRLKDSLPNYLSEFVRVQELNDWLPPQKLAELLDIYSSDRAVKSSSDEKSRAAKSVLPSKKPESSSPGVMPKLWCDVCRKTNHSTETCYRRSSSTPAQGGSAKAAAEGRPSNPGRSRGC